MNSHVDKKILGFDMDGVIVDNSELKLKVAGSFGIKISIMQTPSEILKKFFTPDLWRKMQWKLYDNPLISVDAPLMPGTKKLLEQIVAAKIPYYLISRRLEPRIAIALLVKRGIWPEYFNEANSFFVVTPADKNKRAKALGITHYVDDETKILSALSDVPNKFLFDHLGVSPDSDRYTRVTTHEKLAEYFL